MLQKQILIFFIIIFINCCSVKPRINPFDPIHRLAGEITEDTVWDKEHSPYIICGDIQVRSQATLIIKPGTIIKFLPNTDTFKASAGYLAGELPKADLIIDGGTLIAEGTLKEPIRFTSYSEKPNPGDWGLIQISGKETGHKSIVKYCIIEYACIGIDYWEVHRTNEQNVTIEYTTIKNCKIQGLGIRAGSPIIRYNEIVNCGQYESLGNEKYFEIRGGIILKELANPIINYNNICNNYDIYDNIKNLKALIPLYEVPNTLSYSLTINAQHNYWGTVKEDLIKKGIDEVENYTYTIKNQDNTQQNCTLNYKIDYSNWEQTKVPSAGVK